MIDNSNNKERERAPKKRAEIIQEQKIEKRGKSKNKKKSDSKKKIAQELKEFYSKKAFTPSYYKDKDGVEHEVEYDK